MAQLFLKYVIILIQLSFICAQLTPDVPHCLQEINNLVERRACDYYNKDFCKYINCEPVIECENVGRVKRSIVPNVLGYGCCPACVTYLDTNDTCEVGNKISRCRDGLHCAIGADGNPQTRCVLPSNKNRCLREYTNKKLAITERTRLLIYGAGDGVRAPEYYSMRYADDVEYPTCDHSTGLYSLKQCRKSKCFCVNPDDGKYTFGLSEDYKAENVTCECAQRYFKKLMKGPNQAIVDRNNMEHYAHIHQKCDSAGNYEPLQCINGTCFCVDPQNGEPKLEKSVIFGAISALSCFDEERSKKLKTKDATANYQKSCEKQLLRTRSVALHFLKKNVKIRGLDAITCQYDGDFAPKQCQPGSCHCVNPGGTSLKSYGVDRQGGKDTDMECKCAREEYFAEKDQLAYQRLQCDGMGNFNAYQCFEGGRECFCVDEDGSRISEVAPSACLDDFIKKFDPRILKDDICKAMRKSLTDVDLVSGKCYNFLWETTSVSVTDCTGNLKGVLIHKCS